MPYCQQYCHCQKHGHLEGQELHRWDEQQQAADAQDAGSESANANKALIEGIDVVLANKLLLLGDAPETGAKLARNRSAQGN